MIGIEMCKEAVEDAKHNAKLNGTDTGLKTLLQMWLRFTLWLFVLQAFAIPYNHKVIYYFFVL